MHRPTLLSWNDRCPSPPPTTRTSFLTGSVSYASSTIVLSSLSSRKVQDLSPPRVLLLSSLAKISSILLPDNTESTRCDCCYCYFMGLLNKIDRWSLEILIWSGWSETSRESPSVFLLLVHPRSLFSLVHAIYIQKRIMTNPIFLFKIIKEGKKINRGAVCVH